VRDVQAGRSTYAIASAFHQTIACVVEEVVERLSDRTGIRDVALTGGVFQNALLSELTMEALVHRGFRVHTHRLVPCNDGGIALGQACIASLEANA
jgi:hydrogenase maturation protein HypF